MWELVQRETWHANRDINLWCNFGLGLYELQHLKTTERLPIVVRNGDKVSKQPSVTYKIEDFHLLYSC